MPASSRRAERTADGLLARRLAMLALFEDEFRPGSAVSALGRVADERGVSDEVRDHAARIVAGVVEHRADLDARIAAEAPLIPVPELGRVERTILRSALYEVLYSAATPSGETMRDSVSLARIYAGDSARRLVNGVLGSVSRSPGGGA
ncbi:MAG TPA: transcription antitermination protein NusB [Candidatus Angelobacter sp.]|nr:transcription antitermination protein NusB [Candidatus Angelobacter sp.]